MRRFLCIVSVLVMTLIVRGEVIEDWLESTDYPEELQEWLQEMREHPLDLNLATFDELIKLPFIDRSVAGKLIKLRAELGGIESFDVIETRLSLTEAQVSSLRDFTMVSANYHTDDKALLRTSASASADQEKSFESASAACRMRADFSSGNGTSGFIFALRRPGQTEFLDETSFGIDLPREQYRPRLVAGDFQIESGTGLVFATAFGMGSWLSSLDAASPPQARGLSARPSSSRLAVQRGIATEWSQDGFSGRVFGAINRLDAATLNGETVEITEGASSSFDLEKARENQLEERLVGANLSFTREHYQVGASAYSAEFSLDFREQDALDPLPGADENPLRVGSVDANANLGSIQAISEVAASSGGGVAHQSALTLRETNAAWSLYHVYAGENFYSPHSRLWGGFGEDAGNACQTGIRTQMRGSGYQLVLSGSTERTPYRTTTSPLRKAGDHVSALVRLHPGAAFELSTLIDRRWNELTSASEAAIMRRTDRARFELLLHGQEEYKLRVELKSSARNTSHEHALGTLVFFQLKAGLWGLQTFSRIAVWNIEHSDASMALYENSVYGGYPLVSINGTGRRISLLLRKSWSHLRIGAKLGQTSSESLNESRETVDFAFEISYSQ